MPRYAQYDSASPSPAPVTGWYDTDILAYPNLPPASDLIEVDASNWALHFNSPGGWTVEDGKLIPPEFA